MTNPDQFLRDDQKKAREKAKNTNATNAFHDKGNMIDQNMSRSQDFGSKNENQGKNQSQKPSSNIVQSDQKLKTSQAKTSQQIDSIKQQMNKANKSKETAKTQTETEKQDKSKSM